MAGALKYHVTVYFWDGQLRAATRRTNNPQHWLQRLSRERNVRGTVVWWHTGDWMPATDDPEPMLPATTDVV